MIEVRSYETRAGSASSQHRTRRGRVALDALTAQLDARRGVLLASELRIPWSLHALGHGLRRSGLVLVARGRSVAIEALNRAGVVLLPPIARALADLAAGASFEGGGRRCGCSGAESEGRFPEEDESPAIGVLGAARAGGTLGSDADAHLGLLRCVRLRLALQFEPLRLHSSGPRASAIWCSTCLTSCCSSTIARGRDAAATSSAATALRR